MASKILAPKYVLVDGEFCTDMAVTVGGDGTIEAVGSVPLGSNVEHLGDVAIIPGLVNAHSHAFQRAIRGRTHRVDPQRSEDDFWSWREQMYGVAMRVQPDDVYAIARWTFIEMLLSGITTVGEFHYLHHQPDGTPYDDPNELAHRVIAAARDAGIRICLLRVAYQRGGFAVELAERQRRFVDERTSTILQSVDDLRTRYAAQADVSVGIAPHSIRAVNGSALRKLAAAAQEWDLPLHIHACEQRREIKESIAEYGKPPIEVLADLGLLGPRLTVVHGTHVSGEELDVMFDAQPTVCACPTTERDLGDGFLPASELTRRSIPIALGTDSHAAINLWEDARCVELHERLRTERRNVLAHAARTEDTALQVWPMLAENGARSLRLPTGRLEAGMQADLIALDLGHPSLVGASQDDLLGSVVFAAAPGAVKHVWVSGNPVVVDGHHPDAANAAEAFSQCVS